MNNQTFCESEVYLILFKMARDISQAEYFIYERLYKNLGARIKFRCDNVTYIGIIDEVKPRSGKVFVRHAKVVENNKYFGNLRFNFCDIPSFSIVESAEDVNRHPKNEYLLNILKSNKPKQYSTISEVLFEDEESESDDDNKIEEEEEDVFILDVPSHLKHALPSDTAIIDSIGTDFHLAVEHISKQNAIGVSFEGRSISRFGKLTSVCISTTTCVFLFDIKKLKNEAFDGGLRHIFEEKTIKKIIHDSRFPCDCLTWQYSTRLSNVFDTRVADFLVTKQRYNDKFDFDSFSTLDCCLRNYLDVPQEFLFKRDTSSTSAEKETHNTTKTISNALAYDLMKDALYLILLQEKLKKELQAPFRKTVASCQRVLAKASRAEFSTLGNELSTPDAIPPTLFMQGIQTAGFRRPTKKCLTSLECKFIDPKTHDIVEPKEDLRPQTVIQRNLHSQTTNKRVSVFDKKSHSLIAKNNEDSVIKNVESQCNSQEENARKEIQMLPIESSSRYMDEVFHKLANKVYSDSPDSVVLAKPPDSYISKFCVKTPFFDCTTLNSSPESNISHFEESHDNSGSSQDYSETWAKIRAEIAAEDVSASNFNKRKIVFVPA